MTSGTRLSLLASLRDSGDGSGWRRFDRRYRPMVLAFCRKRRLNEADAQDVAQDVLATFMVAYRKGAYDHAKGKLRSWLFEVTRRRIIDLARRAQAGPIGAGEGSGDGFVGNAESRESLEAAWEAEWRDFVLRKCLKAVRRRVEPLTFRIFLYYVRRDRAASEVAQRFGVDRETVYVAKSRILGMIRRLREQMEHP